YHNSLFLSLISYFTNLPLSRIRRHLAGRRQYIHRYLDSLTQVIRFQRHRFTVINRMLYLNAETLDILPTYAFPKPLYTAGVKNRLEHIGLHSRFNPEFRIQRLADSRSIAGSIEIIDLLCGSSRSPLDNVPIRKVGSGKVIFVFHYISFSTAQQSFVGGKGGKYHMRLPGLRYLVGNFKDFHHFGNIQHLVITEYRTVHLQAPSGKLRPEQFLGCNLARRPITFIER